MTHTYEIWQYNIDHDMCYMNDEFHEKRGCLPEKSAYTMVYAGNVDCENDIFEIVERLYQKFNVEIPPDYTGRSLSVSDVVVIDGEAWFYGSIGFFKLNNW